MKTTKPMRSGVKNGEAVAKLERQVKRLKARAEWAESRLALIDAALDDSGIARLGPENEDLSTVTRVGWVLFNVDRMRAMAQGDDIRPWKGKADEGS